MQNFSKDLGIGDVLELSDQEDEVAPAVQGDKPGQERNPGEEYRETKSLGTRYICLRPFGKTYVCSHVVHSRWQEESTALSRFGGERVHG